jgi:branched-chain amino acid aminotransferase
MLAGNDRLAYEESAMAVSSDWSQTWTFFDGQWHEGNPPLVGPRSHTMWLASTVFDGARAFEGRTPDLDLHLARVNRSAVAMGLLPKVAPEMWDELVRDGLKRFAPNTALYIKPMYWAEKSGVTAVAPDPDSTRWCLTLYELPMPGEKGQAITLSPFRKPTAETAPVDAKAACLYPNNARAGIEAHGRGFDNALLLDMLGNVAELATSNVFLGKDGVVFTPAPNGTFLNGITRQRTVSLLREDGVEVVEKSLSYKDFLEADEIFSSGNAYKVHPVSRIEERALQPGPLYRRARALYWDFAHR